MASQGISQSAGCLTQESLLGDGSHPPCDWISSRSNFPSLLFDEAIAVLRLGLYKLPNPIGSYIIAIHAVKPRIYAVQAKGHMLLFVACPLSPHLLSQLLDISILQFSYY